MILRLAQELPSEAEGLEFYDFNRHLLLAELERLPFGRHPDIDPVGEAAMHAVFDDEYFVAEEFRDADPRSDRERVGGDDTMARSRARRRDVRRTVGFVRRARVGGYGHKEPGHQFWRFRRARGVCLEQRVGIDDNRPHRQLVYDAFKVLGYHEGGNPHDCRGEYKGERPRPKAGRHINTAMHAVLL